ncbi:low density lipoprotein receptor adapter protein 1-A [Vanessa tameamea]|uniref:Low density lipoprotein receptor adapter protein 1-A n=1 Tax=Vanessa tameamea TaxID=334116 RepID=A0ABM4AW11_VANTA|nr:low density lipoprotein receptor adapter protein 1-A [Vanessa tameamea]XP_047541396.1 low density lipoprotein receptor adapter protein 1-A [Vanessa atalanta]
MAENEGPVLVNDLPMTFQVKYLGQSDARGLWGIKHTRKPVDLMVAAAKALPPGQVLPLVKLTITVDGVHLETIKQDIKNEFEHMAVFFNIESISYGVQDLVYTRVFSMIIVKDSADVKGLNPFECHAFVCESRNAARRLTYSLAAAFQDYSRRVKEMQTAEIDERPPSLKKRFAIDLRTPEEIEADLETEA